MQNSSFLIQDLACLKHRVRVVFEQQRHKFVLFIVKSAILQQEIRITDQQIRILQQEIRILPL